MQMTIERRTNGAAVGLGVGALVLGLLALTATWVPIFGCIGLPFAIISVLLGVIGVFMGIVGGGRGVGWPIAGGLMGLIAIIVYFLMTGAVISLTNMGREHAEQRDRERQQQQQQRETQRRQLLTARLVEISETGDRMTLQFELTNATEKTIKAARGTVVVKNQFGEVVWRTSFEHTERTEPGGTFSVAARVSRTDSTEVQEILRKHRDDLEVEALADTVVYEDGSRFEYEGKE